MLSALEAAIVEGNRVVCLPLSGLRPSKEEEMAYERAASMGVIVVCGAGNSSSKTPEFPAGYPSCISVGATDRYNLRASFSNYGDWITTFAPGKNIPVAKAHKKFDKWSGTSFSCGIVAGIIGLMLKANKNLKFEQIREILISSC
jgi:thermitase